MHRLSCISTLLTMRHEIVEVSISLFDLSKQLIFQSIILVRALMMLKEMISRYSLFILQKMAALILTLKQVLFHSHRTNLALPVLDMMFETHEELRTHLSSKFLFVR